VNAKYGESGDGRTRSRCRSAVCVAIGGRRHGSGRQRPSGHEQQRVGGLDEAHSVTDDSDGTMTQTEQSSNI
jgi:hypothetical protein